MSQPPPVSQLDGRRVAALPQVSLETIESGAAMRQSETWLEDHVPARARLLEYHAAFSSGILSRTVQSGVYLGDPQGIQFEDPPKIAEKPQLADDARTFAATLNEADIPLLWVYVPRREEVFNDRIPQPWREPWQSGGEVLKDVMRNAGPNFLDLTPTLSDPSRRDAFFWRTDHHWTDEGARAALADIGKSVREFGVPFGTDDRQFLDRNYGDFYGSTGRAVTAGAVARVDEFTISTPPSWRARLCPANNMLRTSCSGPTFNSKLARGSDKYSNKYRAFLGGDYGFHRMTNSDPAAQGRILLVKDSFGNAMSTYLAEQVAELVTIDERHYRGPKLTDLIR
ncbi:MAG: DHHW family protein, partial [Angustibacter sp.]